MVQVYTGKFDFRRLRVIISCIMVIQLLCSCGNQNNRTNKYSVFHEKYMKGIMTKDEFLKWYRNPLHYHPELPKNNRSHRFE